MIPIFHQHQLSSRWFFLDLTIASNCGRSFVRMTKNDWRSLATTQHANSRNDGESQIRNHWRVLYTHALSLAALEKGTPNFCSLSIQSLHVRCGSFSTHDISSSTFTAVCRTGHRSAEANNYARKRKSYAWRDSQEKEFTRTETFIQTDWSAHP